jgi:hypothetical protein
VSEQCLFHDGCKREDFKRRQYWQMQTIDSFEDLQRVYSRELFPMIMRADGQMHLAYNNRNHPEYMA